jgi:hypothetical protein
MEKASKSFGAYYYAGGQKVELAPADDLLAVDMPRIPDRVLASFATVAGPFSSGVLVINRTDLGANAGEVVQVLERAGALHPVFRSHGAVVVALPEVRVEESRATKRQHLEKWLTSHAAEAVVESRHDDRIVLKPVSGRGVDALALANQLTEQVGPELAQVRFLRVIPYPSNVRS